MGPLSYVIAIVCIGIAIYFWYNNNQLESQVKASSRTDITSSKTKSSQKFLDFDEDCKIRRLQLSDLDTVKALTNSDGGSQYFLDHSLQPFLSDSNKECLGFGVEHNASKKIICTQFIQMVDDNETGLVLGAMMDNEFQSDARIIYMRLSNEVQAQLTVMFDQLGKHRCIQFTNKPSYVNNKDLDWKIKFNLDVMSDDNIYYILNEKKSDTEDGIKVNGDFKECDDIDKIMRLFVDKFKVNDVLIDSKLYQTKCLKKVLVDEMKEKRLLVMVNHEETGLCLFYGNEDYHIYGASGDDVLSGVRFAKSRTSDDIFGAIFVSKAMVDGNDALTKIFAKTMGNPVMSLDYDMHIDGH